MTDPATLMLAIEADCQALDQAAKELDTIATGLIEAEIAYLDAMDDALVAIAEHYAAQGERLPSERQREAEAHQRLDDGLRGRYLRLKRQKEQWAAWGKLHENALSGRQSQLSFLKAEGTAPQAQGPVRSQTFGRRAA